MDYLFSIILHHLRIKKAVILYSDYGNPGKYYSVMSKSKDGYYARVYPCTMVGKVWLLPGGKTPNTGSCSYISGWEPYKITWHKKIWKFLCRSPIVTLKSIINTIATGLKRIFSRNKTPKELYSGIHGELNTTPKTVDKISSLEARSDHSNLLNIISGYEVKLSKARTDIKQKDNIINSLRKQINITIEERKVKDNIQKAKEIADIEDDGLSSIINTINNIE